MDFPQIQIQYNLQYLDILLIYYGDIFTFEILQEFLLNWI